MWETEKKKTIFMPHYDSLEEEDKEKYEKKMPKVIRNVEKWKHRIWMNLNIYRILILL